MPMIVESNGEQVFAGNLKKMPSGKAGSTPYKTPTMNTKSRAAPACLGQRSSTAAIAIVEMAFHDPHRQQDHRQLRGPMVSQRTGRRPCGHSGPKVRWC